MDPNISVNISVLSRQWWDIDFLWQMSENEIKTRRSVKWWWFFLHTRIWGWIHASTSSKSWLCRSGGLGNDGQPGSARTCQNRTPQVGYPFEGGLSPHVLFSHPRHVKYTPDVARIILTNSNENLRLLEDVFHIGGEDYHLAISKWRHL